MCQQLREIYDKKSPIFLIEIYILTASVIILTNYSTPLCDSSLPAFYHIIIIVSSLEIFSKSIVLAIVHAINKEISNSLQTVLVAIFVICHLSIWIFSIIMFHGDQFQNCRNQEPHYFFIKMYIYIYGIMFLGSLILLIVLLIPVALLTLFSFRKKDSQYQQFE